MILDNKLKSCCGSYLFSLAILENQRELSLPLIFLHSGSICKNRPIFVTICDVLYYTELCNFFQTDTDPPKEQSSFLKQLMIPKYLAVSTQIFLLPLSSLTNFRLLPVNKMVATDIQPGILDMESHVLAMDERWLEKILDTKKFMHNHSVPSML